MKKGIAIIGYFMLLAAVVTAQTEYPVVVVNAKGKISYYGPAAKKPISVQSGSVLKKEGMLSLMKESKTLLYYVGAFEFLKKPGKVKLTKLFNKKDDLQNLNFDLDFAKYTQGAVEMVALKASDVTWKSAFAKRSGDGWAAIKSTHPKAASGWAAIQDPATKPSGWESNIIDPKKTGDAWGGKGNSISAIMPYGKVETGKVTFTWSRPADAKYYNIEITENGKSVSRSIQNDTVAVIDLTALNLKPNVKYAWKVTMDGATQLSSDMREFTIASAEELAAAVKKASNSDIYTTADATTKGIMEAVSLEKSNWYGAAADKYASLLAKDKSNEMLRMMASAFWMRMGFEPIAKGIFSK